MCRQFSHFFALPVSSSTECVTDLDLQSEMIMVQSLLTTFEVSIIFEAAGAITKIGMSLVPNNHNS